MVCTGLLTIISIMLVVVTLPLSLVLVVGEAVAWLDLYSGLESSQHEVILYLLLAPTLVTSLAWLSTSCRWRVSWSTTCSLLGLLLLSLPSPVLLLLFHLYKTVKGRPLSSLVAFTQLARALSCSLPLVVYGKVWSCHVSGYNSQS